MVGNFVHRYVATPIVVLSLTLAVVYFAVGRADTAAFAKTTVAAVGTGFGLTIGLIPAFFDAMKDGKAAVDDSSAVTVP